MKDFELIYDPTENEDMILFNNIDIQKLSLPISIQREEPVQEEEQPFSKKKSEIIDYENEDYLNLKGTEREPWNIIDCESRVFSGKLQDMSNNSGSMYFAFINMGDHLKVVPITKWYGFVQKNIFIEGDILTLEKNLEQFDAIDNDEEYTNSDQQVDFEENFDDDDGEEYEVYVQKEKSLTLSGQQLKGIVENYDDENKSQNASDAEEESNTEEHVKQIKITRDLTKDDIKEAFGRGSISVKDLLKILKINYKINDKEKILIREFIHESCVFETAPKTGEKMFKLKNNY